MTALAISLLLALAAVASCARADVWGYVDERGVSHFAPSQVDSRYRLFFKGRSSLDPPAPAAPTVGPAEVLQDHPIYKRVADNPNVKRYAALIEANAKANGLDPALVNAMIAVESAFDPAAVSPKGAVGLMQVLPATAERYGVMGDARRSVEQKLVQPAINLRVGTRYLRDLLARFDNDLVLAVAAYNAGEGAVDQYNKQVPPYPETQDYVKLVQQFRELYRPPPPPPPHPAATSPARVKILPRKATP